MKDNYEKVLLGAGALTAIALGAVGFMALKKVDADFGELDARKSAAEAIKSRPFIESSVSSLTSPPSLRSLKNPKGRDVELFSSVPIFVKKGEKELVDLLLSEPVHPPIENTWWLKHKIDPGYGDSPQRDEDGDGFSNLEEYEAKTDPTDENSLPSLFAKVQVSELKETKWLMKFSDYGATGYAFNIEDTKGQKNRIKGGGAVKAGEKFFPEGAYANRFLFKEALKKDDGVMERPYAKVEDLKLGKEGKIYEFPNNNKPVNAVSDYTVTLFLDTPDEKGKPFDIEEGMSFSLPYDEKAAEKPYIFKEVQDNGASILLLWDNNGESKQLKLDVPK